MKEFIRHNILPAIAKVAKVDIELYYKIWYTIVRKRLPNLKNSIDFSEIMISRMLSDEWQENYRYVDKVLVRDYLKEKGLGDYLTKSYGVFKDANEINFEKLPNSFVLKTNNGCGGHVICKDKSKLDVPSTIKYLNDKLKEKYNHRYEPQYRKIEPLILSEELLDDGTGYVPTDYKYQCFKGKPSYIFVGTERDKKVKYTTFDLEWNRLHYVKESFSPETVPSKPKNLKLMKEIAEKLSSDFEFVRVDLYDLGDRVLFGELTFSPGSAIVEFFTDEAIGIMGKEINS